jgi:tocopherol cyclase
MRPLDLAVHPAWFHGHGKRPPYFEGWYFKLVDAAERHRWAIIPGVAYNPAGREPSHCFVQVLDGTTGRATYHTYPLDAFWAAQSAFDVRVGPNRFQADRITLDIHDAQRSLSGTVSLGELQPWPVSLASPGIMGWFAWVPFMQCYHGVLGLDHALQGTLTVDGESIDWQGGRGYIEKDWGRAFPSAYIWMQCNHFAQLGTSLTLSLARIPWLGLSFRGLIAGLWHERQLYRLATYSGVRLEALEAADQHVRLVLRDARHRLEVLATRSLVRGDLRGPSGADMGVRVPESLLGQVAVKLWQLRPEPRLLFDQTGRNAGIEVVGTL